VAQGRNSKGGSCRSRIPVLFAASS
jgi:hypothetical protein